MKIRVPENIDLLCPEKYVLIFHLHPEQYSFLLFCPTDAASLYYSEAGKGKTQDAFASFKELFFENEFFTLAFQKVYVINHTPDFTYVPDWIDAGKYGEEFMQYLFSEKGGKTLHQSVSLSDMQILHRIPEKVYDFFVRSFDNPDFIHHTAPLIAWFLPKSRATNTRQMFINMQEKEMDILCFLGSDFLLGNHYRFDRLQDAVYYILFTFKQLKYSQLGDFIRIVGNISLGKDLAENLKLYIRHIIPETIPIDLPASENIPFELAAFVDNILSEKTLFPLRTD
jgi:hypothetical protein